MKNVTLGEIKARCIELTEKFGDDCCKECEFNELGCCLSPDKWKIEAVSRPSEADWFEAIQQAQEATRSANRSIDELLRLRTIVSVVETIIGRKFDI